MKNKFYRTLIRVSKTDPDFFFVIIPGWSVKTELCLRRDLMPKHINKEIKPGKRLHAMVNIGADSMEELNFRDWEIE